MPKLSVYNMAGKTTGEEIELNEEVFGVEFNEPVVHQAIVRQQSNERQGTSATKTRGMVRGGGRKPWRQKGTGHARVGSTAIRCALSAKVAAGQMVIIDNIAFDDFKTKRTVEMLEAFGAAENKTLIITNGENENVELSARNLRKVTVINNGGLNCFDLLHNNKVFLDKNAVEKIEEVLA